MGRKRIFKAPNPYVNCSVIHQATIIRELSAGSVRGSGFSECSYAALSIPHSTLNPEPQTSLGPTLNFDIIRYNPAVAQAAECTGIPIVPSRGERLTDANAQQSPFLEHEGQNRIARPRQFHVVVLNTK
jgi:hypothetical protein